MAPTPLPEPNSQLLHPGVDPSHAGGLWNPANSPMPFYVKGAIVIAVILIGCLLVELLWVGYKLTRIPSGK